MPILAQLCASVRAYAANNPTHRYQRIYSIHTTDTTALYIHNGHPSCLIGWALWECDLIDVDIEDDPRNTAPIADLLHDVYIPPNLPEVQWLSWVQEYQDLGAPWADVIAEADYNLAHNIPFTH